MATTRRHYVGKDGTERHYETHLLRRSVRDGTKVRNETLANLSHLPDELIEAIRAGLAGTTLVVAGEGLQLTRALPHGHLAAVATMAKTLGLREPAWESWRLHTLEARMESWTRTRRRSGTRRS